MAAVAVVAIRSDSEVVRKGLQTRVSAGLLQQRARQPACDVTQMCRWRRVAAVVGAPTGHGGRGRGAIEEND